MLRAPRRDFLLPAALSRLRRRGEEYR